MVVVDCRAPATEVAGEADAECFVAPHPAVIIAINDTHAMPAPSVGRIIRETGVIATV